MKLYPCHAGQPDPINGRSCPATPGHARPGALKRAAYPARFALVVLLALAGALGVTAPARADVLVSNLGQADKPDGFAFFFAVSQEFVTGDNPGGYTLTSVETKLYGMDAAELAKLTVSLHAAHSSAADSTGAPAASLGTLTHPASVPADNIFEFTTSGIALAAGTRYAVVLQPAADLLRLSDGGEGVVLTVSRNEDTSSKSGWSIVDELWTRHTGRGGRWIRHKEGEVNMKIQINGTVAGVSAPTASDSSVTATEDIDYPFTAADFSFSGVNPGDTLGSVTIRSLPAPATGVLQLNGEDLSALDTITSTELAIGRFTYTSPADANGMDHASFDFRVSDGTARSNTFTMTIHVTAASDRPTARDSAVITNANVDYTFSVADFNFLDSDDGDTLTDVTVVTPPGAGEGALRFRASKVSAGATITSANLTTNNLTYRPPSNVSGPGYASFTFKVSDGAADSVSTYTMTIHVAPTASDSAVTATEDTDYRFSAADFNISGADTLTTVKLVTLPDADKGVLKLLNAPASIGANLSNADFTAGRLIYTPPANANGRGYASFDFLVSDDRDDSVSYTMTIHVTAVNDLPTASDNAVTTDEDTEYPFTVDDFNFLDGDTGDALASVSLVTLPGADQGVLKLDGTPVSVNNIVTRAKLEANSLTYAPPVNANGMDYASFTFQVSDGAADSASPNTMTISVTAVNDPPTASDHTVTANANMDYTFTVDDFNFVDVDGDTLSSISIVAPLAPDTGALQFNGMNRASQSVFRVQQIAEGRFTYRSPALASGMNYASFTFLVYDGQSFNASSNTMTINVTDNLAPTASDNTVTHPVNTDYTFSVTDFNFSDQNAGDALKSLSLVTLPGTGKGVLKLDNVTINATNTTVTLAQLEANDLIYSPPTNANGANYASFTFQVSDGHLSSASSNTMTINIEPRFVPTASDNTVTATEDIDYRFTVDDFRFADRNLGETLTSVSLVTLPDVGKGVLKLDGTAVSVTNTIVTSARINDGHLIYTPPDNANGTDYTSFTFQVSDGRDDSVSPNTMTITVTAVNDPPTGAPGFNSLEPMVGHLLSSLPATIADVDGLNSPNYRYQWVRFDGSAQTDISRATSISYRPSADDVGEQLRVKYTFTDDDGTTGTLTSVTTLAVLAGANTVPTTSDNTVTTNEDTDYRFTVTDFNFLDGDSVDALTSVKLVTLPGAGEGVLKLDGETVSVTNTIVTRARIDDGHLNYIPPANASGSDYASFTFQVSDGRDGGDSVSSNTMTITVTAANDPPTARDRTVTTAEDTNYTFTAADFNFADVDSGSALTRVKLVTLPDAGKGLLQLDGDPVSVNAIVTLVQLDANSLTYAPPANANGSGYASFTFQVSDGAADSGSPNTMTINVTAVDDLPTARDSEVTADENSAYTFSVADFPFADVDGRSLASITLVTMPGAGTGTLQRNGRNIISSVSQPQHIIFREKLDNREYTYSPPANTSGAGHASFTFKVGVFKGRNIIDSATYTMTINIRASVAPTARNSEVTIRANTDYTFSAADFNFDDLNVGDTLKAVTIVTLPRTGRGVLDNFTDDIVGDTEFLLANINVGQIGYIPPAGASGANYASFTFKVRDDTTYSAVYTMTINILANSAPTAANSEVTTKVGVDYRFSVADFHFADQDVGDTLTSVRLVTVPGAGKGALQFDGTPVGGSGDISPANLDDGRFTYRPPANAIGSGYTSFTFQVGDDQPPSATYSAVYTMTINIEASFAPTASDNVVTTDENTDYTFKAADFKFADRNVGDTLKFIRVVTLPDADKGELKYRDAALRADAALTQADLDSRNFIYTPPVNASGADHASFTFRVSEDGSFFSATYTMTIDVTAEPNVAPTASDSTVTATEDTDYPFTVIDFKFADVNSRDALESITLVTLPGAGKGVLELEGEAVRARDSVTRAQINANSLIYVPPVNANGADYARFTFQVSDGAADSASPNTMTITVTAVNDPPTSSNHEVSAYRDGDYTFSAADFPFADVDSEPLRIVQLLTLPDSGTGTLQLNGMNIPSISTKYAILLHGIDNGALTYSPPADTRSADYASFTFKVGAGFIPGSIDSLATYTMTINFQARVAPTAANSAVSANKNTDYTFKAADFRFADVNVGDTLQRVRLVTLPALGKGALRFDGKLFRARYITRAQLDDGRLTYYSPTNASGPGYASFTFQVRDDTMYSATYTMTINLPVNVPPTAGASEVTTRQDTNYPFTAADFIFDDADSADALARVKLVTLPGAGKGLLKLGGVDVSAGDTVTRAQLDARNLTYVPPTNASSMGYARFTFQVSDGTADSVSPNTMTINVTAVPNVAPTARDNVVTADENGNYPFTAADFKFADVNSRDTLAGVKIVTLPSGEGTLTLDGVDVSANALVTSARLGANSLIYTPEANTLGAGYASFAFQVYDGQLFSASRYIMTINVAAPNNPPTALPSAVTATEDTDYTFTAANFKFIDRLNPDDTLASVSLATLPRPGTGVLKLDGAPARVSAIVTKAQLDANSLTYTPPTNASGAGYTNFRFQVNDGRDDSAGAAFMTINVTAVNDAPTTANSAVTIYGNTDYPFKAADFSFADVDSGDTLGIVRILTLPTTGRGTLELNGNPVSARSIVTRAHLDNSRFIYVPPSNASGTDYAGFTFQVFDDQVAEGRLYSSTYPMTINVTTVNNPPTASASAVTAIEDTDYTFTVADFSFSDNNSPDALARVKLVTLPGPGTGLLKLDEMPVSARAIVTRAQLDGNGLTYVPPANANGMGYANFTFQVNDGTADSASSYTMTIHVTAVNDIPTARNSEVTTLVNTDYTFKAADFNFVDVDGHTLFAVLTQSLPALGRGNLRSGNFDFHRLSQENTIGRVSLDNGQISYRPPMNASGVGYASFTFQVYDGHPTGVFGFDLPTYTMTINVLPVAPTASDSEVTTLVNTDHTFTADDFNFVDRNVGDTLASVSLVTLPGPNKGALQLDGSDLTAVVDITRTQLDDGRFTYSPPVNTTGVGYARFTFKVHDGGVSSASTYTMTINVQANHAPTASDSAVTATEDTDYAFTAVDFSFVDRNAGDTLASVKLVTLPGAGTGVLQLDGLPVSASDTVTGAQLAASDLTYVPPVNANGTDHASFTFKVSDGFVDSALSYTMAISVTAVSDPPMASNNEVSAIVNTDYTFSADDFRFFDGDSGDTLASVRIVTLPMVGQGVLQLENSDLTGAADITRANLDNGDFTYTPTMNASGVGYASFTFTVKDGSSTSSALTYTMTITVMAAPVPAVSIVASGAAVTEGTAATFTLTADPAPTSDISVTVTVTDSGAFAEDGQTGTKMVTIGTSGTATLTVTTVEDTIDEPNGAITAAVTDNTGYSAHNTAHTASVTVNDDDAALVNTPVVSVSGGMAVTEGTAATFTLTAVPAPTSGIITVTVTVTDSGAFASRGQTGTKMVTIDAGGTATLTVATLGDTIDEPNGAITVAVTGGGTGYSVDNTAHTAPVTVNDDDATALTLTGPKGDITEGGAKAFTVSLSRALVDGESLVAPLTLTGSATRGTDYTLACASATGVVCASLDSGDATVTFTGSSSAATATSITLTALADSAAEPVETVIIGLGSTTPTGLGGGAMPTDNLADFSIVDPTPVAAFALALHSAPESAGTRNVTVSLSPAQHSETTLTYSVGGTATAGSDNDFTIANSGSVTLSSGATSVDIPVLIVDDSMDESAETVLLTLTAGSGYTVGATSVHTLTINDNDDPAMDIPVVSVSGGMAVTEGTAATFTLTASPAPVSDLVVTVMVTDSGAFAEGGQTGTKTVTINMSGTAALTVTTLGDTIDEPNGAITAAVTDNTGYSAHNTAHTAAVTVNDDDATALMLTGLKGDITEGDTKAFTVNLSRVLVDGESLVAPLTLAGTATRGTDYTLACASATGVACASLDSGTATVTFTGSSSATIATSMTITLTALADNAAEPAETVVIGLDRPTPTGLGGGATTTDTLADFNIVAQTPVAAFDLALQSASEGAGTHNVTVNLSPAQHSETTLTYSVGGTATAGSGNDFTIADSGSVTLSAGATSVDIPVLIADDNADENAETVLLTLTPASGYTVGAKSVHTLTINDNDGSLITTPVVSLSGEMPVTEGTAATFTLTADPVPDSDIGVTVMVTDSGAFAEGGQTGTKTVTIPAGNATATLTVTTVGDTTDESNGAITAAVTRGTGYLVHGSSNSASVTVNDDDATAVTLTGLADAITEGGTKAFTVNLSRGLVDGERLVAPLTLAGTATRGTDYTLACASATGVACASLDSGSATVTFTGSSSTTIATSMTITLMALADNAAETAETVVIGLGTPMATGLDGVATTTDTLADFNIVDPTPVADFDLDVHSASEDAGTRNVTVNLSPAVPHAGITLTYSVGGTATVGSGNDFTIADSGSVTLTVGATSVNIPVLIVDDSMGENAETVLLTLTAGSGYTVGAKSVHTLTINDNDDPPKTIPVVSVSGGMDVTEGTAATFTLTAVPAPDSDISVTVMVTDSGAFAGGGQTGTKTVTIPADTTSAMLTVTTAVDTTDEPNGAITAAVTGGTGYSAHDTAHTASVTVNDDDATAVTLTGLADNITEGGTKAFTVNLNRGLVDGERLVAPLTLNGTATRGTDYTLACASATGVACAGLDSGDATVTFTGSSSATTATLMTITLMALADNAAEPEETVVIGLGTLRITGLDGGAAHTDNLSDFRIVDPTPVAAFELALRSASEDAGTHNVTVNLSPAQHSETTLNYSVGGTATAGSGNDFTIANSGSVTVSAGATSVNIPVLIVDDNADEGAETVILTLTAVTGYTVGATSVHTLTINDDDGSLMTTPVVSVSGGMAVTEGTDVTFTLTADPAPDSDISVAVMVTDSGAFAGGGQTGTKTVTIRAGTTSAMLTVTTAVDTTDEPNGAITAAVTRGTGYSAHDTAHTASVTVNDDDATAVTLTGLADNITEGGTKAFTVNLNRGLVDGERLVAPLTLNGTATRGTDYTLACASATGVACASLDSGSATVTFTGSSSATTATLMTITLMALADNAAEPEETVVIGLGTLRITGLDGAAHTDNLSDFRIVDPTPVAAFELALRSASEDAGTHNVTVNLSPAQHSETTLNYSVGGTATAGSGNDFTIANSGSVTVSAGATSVNIPVLIVDDNADEGAETVILTLTAVTGYTVGATSVHTLTINDDDGSLMTTPVVSVSGGMAVTEGTDVTFTLTADPAPDSDLLVAVMVTDSGAFAGGGQTGTKTVTIRAGTTSAMLTVTTAVDTIDEPNGAITAAVTGGTGYSAHDTAHTASVTVNDDDATAVTLTGLADNITEGGTKAFTVNLNRGLVDGESLAAPLTLAGTATRGTDYTLACASATGVACAGLDSGDATVTFTGSSSATIATSMTITLMALADNAAEPEETVVIGLGTPMVTGLDGGAKPIDTLADFNIVDPTPVADFDVDVHSASENAGTHNVTVNLSPAQHSETTLTYSVGGTATAGSGNDFTIANSGSVTLSAGATSVDIPVLIVDDNADENAETVLLTLIPASGYTVGSTNVHTLTINDNDATVVTLTGLADNITEGDTKAFTVNLSRALVDGEKLVAPLTLNGTATRGTDYTLACASATGVACASLDSGSATVTFTGSSSATTATLMTITLMALADNAAEPTAETVVIGLGTPTATGLDGVATTTDNLADFGIVDPTPVAAFDVDVQSVSEGAGTHNVTVNLSPAVPHAGITLTYSVGGTATVGSGNDFTIADSGSVTLSSGATSVNIPVLIVDDSMDENAETVLLTLTPASGYTVGATSVHTLTINDNDAPAMGTPVVSVSGGMAVTEGTAATFTLTADPAPDSNISVTVTVTDSGAFAGVGQTGTKTVTINTSGTATLTVTTVNDTIDESNGAITAAVTHGTGYSVHNTTYIASVTVNDNDAAAGLPPTNTPPAFGSASSARVAENQSAVLTVTAVEAQAQDGAVRYSLSGGEDQARFLIDRETGALTFAGLPDYENPDDSAGNNEYIVTVRATSGAGLRERSAEQTITVTVTGVDEVVLKPRDAVTESGVYQLGRSTITATITATATASAEVSVTLPDALVDVNGEVIRRLSIEIVDAPSTTPLPNRNQFKFDKEKLVDINVWPAPKGGVELCLPVSAALRAAADADGQPLAALHFTSGRWLALAGADKGEQVCVSGVSRFSPFMAGFRTVASASMERALSTWLARFGRTVTDQVLEAVTDRLAAPRSPGMKVSLAGRALPIRGQDSTVREDRPHGNAAGSLRASLAERGALDALSNWISHTGAVGDDLPHGAPGAGSRALQSWSPTGRDLTFGTSFSLTGEPRADGSLLSVWGRGAMTNFAGRDGGLALDGEAQTLLVGAERSWRGWTTGGVLGRSRAEGGYRSAAEAGEIEATLTGVYPWAGRAVNDHVSAWAALGYGAGDLTFQPEDGAPVRADLILALGAAGLRGEVLRPLQAGGLSLAVKGDVRVTRTSSKAAGDTMVGRLMAAEADVWRVRAGVEGARSFMANGDPLATVTPSFEVGVRLDGGDAETGFGADVGGGVALVDPGRGVTLEMKARGLVSHEDKDFREWGASAALAWEPRPQSGRGLSLSLTQSWGVSSSGGMDALLSRDTLVGLAASDTAPAGRRLEAELGYAMTVFGGDFTATPNAGLTLTEDGRDWRLGWRLTPAWPDGSGFDVDLDATRSETGDGTPAHAVTLRGALRF